MGRASPSDTIAAIASPPGGASRAIVRLSGPRVRAILSACFAADLPDRRGARTGTLRDGGGEQPALLLWMPAPHSYTGEDVAELHVVGASPLVAAALARVVELGARVAQPGEFTRRAFENGRIDLARAEAVLALVAARDAEEHRAAARLLFGGVGARAARAEDRLLDLRALAEAALDFDESDTGAVARDELLALLDDVRAGIASARGELAASGPPAGVPRVVLLGAPNAGKTSLFNALTGERALVSARPGTTRDALVATWRTRAGPVELVDLPGLEQGAIGVDREAQERAREIARGADLVLWVVSATADDVRAPDEGALATSAPTRLVWSRIDAPGARPEPPHALARAFATPAIATSALTRVGLDELADVVAAAVGDPHDAAASGAARELAARHAAALAAAEAELAAGADVLGGEGALDLVAAHFAAASTHLDELTGRGSPEDVLDRIFARFCLGK